MKYKIVFSDLDNDFKKKEILLEDFLNNNKIDYNFDIKCICNGHSINNYFIYVIDIQNINNLLTDFLKINKINFRTN